MTVASICDISHKRCDRTTQTGNEMHMALDVGPTFLSIPALSKAMFTLTAVQTTAPHLRGKQITRSHQALGIFSLCDPPQ